MSALSRLSGLGLIRLPVEEALETLDGSIDHKTFTPLSRAEIIWEPGQIIANLMSEQKKETELFTRFTEMENAEYIVAEDFLSGADAWFYVSVNTDLAVACALLEWVEGSSYTIIRTVENGSKGMLYIAATPLKSIIKHAK